MKPFFWDIEKNQRILRQRGVCFEQAVVLLESGTVLDVMEHPNQGRYPGQWIAILEIDAYAYLVPYEEKDDGIYLKTMIPSRKMTAKYLSGRRQ